MYRTVESSNPSTRKWPFVIDRSALASHRRKSPRGLTQSASGPVQFVPQPLRHIGCMWLEDGDESRRCRKKVAWTVGISLSWPRVYCEKHGRLILQRHNREKMRRRQRCLRKDPSLGPIDGIEICDREIQPV